MQKVEELKHGDILKTFEEEKDVHASIYTQVKKLRQEQGLSQKRLAKLAHIRQQEISDIEGVQIVDISLETLIKIARVLNRKMEIKFIRQPKKLYKKISINLKIPKRFYNDRDWAFKNYNSLYKKYGERWIAIYKRKVVASSDDGFRSLTIARKKTGVEMIPIVFMDNMHRIYKA